MSNHEYENVRCWNDDSRPSYGPSSQTDRPGWNCPTDGGYVSDPVYSSLTCNSRIQGSSKCV